MMGTLSGYTKTQQLTRSTHDKSKDVGRQRQSTTVHHLLSHHLAPIFSSFPGKQVKMLPLFFFQSSPPFVVKKQQSASVIHP